MSRKTIALEIDPFRIRMSPILHEQLASWAKQDKVSLNALIVDILEKAMERHSAKAGPKD